MFGSATRNEERCSPQSVELSRPENALLRWFWSRQHENIKSWCRAVRLTSGLAVVVLTLTTLFGCGEGYRVEPAILNVTVASENLEQQILSVVSDVLKSDGFEDFGRYDEMIALIRQNPAMSGTAKESELARLYRERTYLNQSRHLSVVWADYAKAAPADMASLRYKPPSNPFVEISIYDERPGGFGADGLTFYKAFLSALKDKYGAAVVVAQEPPPTNVAEYRRIKTINGIATVLEWFAALLVPLLFTGLLSVFLLKRLRISNLARRIVFVLVNTWMVTPLPFPATITVIPAPNLLAFPWTHLDFYSRVASFAAVSFPCALVVCAFVSMRLFKTKPGRVAS